MVCGSTFSTDFNLVEQIDSYYDDVMVGQEGFMNLYDTKNDLKISSYIGGDRNDEITSIGNFISSGGEHLVFSGTTSSTNFDVRDIPGTIDYFEGLPQGANDGFVMTLNYCNPTCKISSVLELSTTNITMILTI